jgi:ABC-type microcin C transport system duplicated ATPase subunit YejF
MSTTQLHIKELTVSFNNQTVVQNLHLLIEKGKTTAIVGESGSGKSVTAMAILGLLPNNAKVTGEMHFENEQLLLLSEKKMRLIRGKKISKISTGKNTSIISRSWYIRQ